MVSSTRECNGTSFRSRGWIRDVLRHFGAPLLVLLALLTVGAGVRSIDDVQRFGGVDLRPRIVGALRLFSEKSPYIDATDANPREMVDPLGMGEISRCGYPPSLLLAYRIGATTGYRALRYSWAAVEWGAMLLTVALVARTTKRKSRRMCMLTGAVLLFICHGYWRLHVERGQYYIFVALLWAVAWSRIRQRGPNDILTGVALGLAAALRPSTLVVVLPMLVLNLPKLAFGTIAAAVSVLGGTLAFGARRWSEFGQLVRFYEAATARLVEYKPLVPSTVVFDGYDLTRFADIRTGNESIIAVMAQLVHVLRLESLRPFIASASKVIVCGAFLAFVFWLWLHRRNRWSREGVFLAVVFSALLADFIAPIRWGYSQVLYLVPFLVAIANVKTLTPRTRKEAWLLCFLVGGLLAGSGIGGLPGTIETCWRGAALLSVIAHGIARDVRTSSATSEAQFGCLFERHRGARESSG